jgi:hypothetical protein
VRPYNSTSFIPFFQLEFPAIDPVALPLQMPHYRVPPILPWPIKASNNGLHGLGIAVKYGNSVKPVPPSTEMFSSVSLVPPETPLLLLPRVKRWSNPRQLAVSINLGLEMLETEAGMSSLRRLGRELIVRRRELPRPWYFSGNVANIDAYVRHFLRRVRGDFPHVIVEAMSSIETLAFINKGPWVGDLGNFQPKPAGSISYNRSVGLPR